MLKFQLLSIMCSNSSVSNPNGNIHNINGRSLWRETKNSFINSFYYNVNFNNYNSFIKTVYEYIFSNYLNKVYRESMIDEYCKDYILITK